MTQMTQTANADGSMVLKCSGTITNLSGKGQLYKNFYCGTVFNGRNYQTTDSWQKVGVPEVNNLSYTELTCNFRIFNTPNGS